VNKQNIKTRLIAEFDEKVNELRNSHYKSEHIEEFGYRHSDDGKQIHTVTDFGNIKNFITYCIDEVLSDIVIMLEDAVKKSEKMYMDTTYFTEVIDLINSLR